MSQQEHHAQADKNRLRDVIRVQRRERDDAERARQRGLLVEVIVGWARRELPAGAVVAAYEAWPSEPASPGLLAALADLGHPVLVPETLADRSLDWRRWPGGDLLGADALGQARLILVPAFAVDRAGRRLGRGGGSYDRALSLRAPDAVVAAVLFEGEDGHRVPTDPWDVAVDAIVTPAVFRRLRA